MPSGTEPDTAFAFELTRDPMAPVGGEREYDALADLFLGDAAGEPASGSTAEDPAKPCVIELLVSGHLPGASAPWPAQYAAESARRVGAPVALIRAGAGEVSVDLFGDDPAAKPLSTLEGALDHCRRRAAAALLRLDDDDVSPGLAALRKGDRVTILTGADEAATVDTYRRLKSIADSAPAGAELGVAVMGADEIEAGRAFDHLTRACEAFLDRPLRRAPGVHRIGPVQRVNLHRRPSATGAVGILRALADPRHTGTPTLRADRPNPPTEQQPPAAHLGAPAATQRPSDTAPGPLASRISGLTPIESRCPWHESVELATDAAGGLALVASGGLDRVGELLAVRAWAAEHARLLAKAEPAISEARDAAVHAVTESVAEAHRLSAAGVRAHLLIRAQADGWACVPMDA